MSERIVFEEPINGRAEVLRAAISEYQGKDFVHLRVWFYPQGTPQTPDNLRPGKGLALLAGQFGMIDRAVAALRRALATSEHAVDTPEDEPGRDF